EAQFLLNPLSLPMDILLSCILPYIQQSSAKSQRCKLPKIPLWKKCQLDILS
ncbi:uncharacterized protein BX663DRAFT_443996, partial [Cokeromyces recurvatus]|uniref:uncharacterized protein n=1 Tax=Cokeromyces recurvatus TaxID=90255 RepID=UPI00222086D8